MKCCHLKGSFIKTLNLLKVVQTKKKHRFPTTYVPALSRWIEGYWQLKKKHIIISVKGVWPPRFNLDKKGSGKMPASKELKPENPTATALKNFILRKFIGWLRPPFCCCICYSYPTHWWSWWILKGSWSFHWISKKRIQRSRPGLFGKYKTPPNQLAYIYTINSSKIFVLYIWCLICTYYIINKQYINMLY